MSILRINLKCSAWGDNRFKQAQDDHMDVSSDALALSRAWRIEQAALFLPPSCKANHPFHNKKVKGELYLEEKEGFEPTIT